MKCEICHEEIQTRLCDTCRRFLAKKYKGRDPEKVLENYKNIRGDEP